MAPASSARSFNRSETAPTRSTGAPPSGATATATDALPLKTISALVSSSVTFILIGATYAASYRASASLATLASATSAKLAPRS